jgi:hypothetical protein
MKRCLSKELLEDRDNLPASGVINTADFYAALYKQVDHWLLSRITPLTSKKRLSRGEELLIISRTC